MAGVETRASMRLAATTVLVRMAEDALRTVESIIVSAHPAGVVTKTVRMRLAAMTTPAGMETVQQMGGSIIVSALMVGVDACARGHHVAHKMAPNISVGLIATASLVPTTMVYPPSACVVVAVVAAPPPSIILSVTCIFLVGMTRAIVLADNLDDRTQTTVHKEEYRP